MTIRVGINGFGRIGRMVLRAAVRDFPDIQVVGINDLLEPDYLAYMLAYDSVHGRFKGTVAIDGSTMVVNGKKIRLTAVKDPAEYSPRLALRPVETNRCIHGHQCLHLSRSGFTSPSVPMNRPTRSRSRSSTHSGRPVYSG